jgi:hypothetical protein
MSYPIIIWFAVWAALIIPVGRWARRNLRDDRVYEGDELDPISASGAAAFGLIWAGLWPFAVIAIIIRAVCWLIGLLIDSQLRV